MQAIDAIGAFQAENKFSRSSGISVKLSALHPRYEMAQRDRVLREMVPKLAAMCGAAARVGRLSWPRSTMRMPVPNERRMPRSPEARALSLGERSGVGPR